MTYETPEIEVIGAASELVQDFAGPHVDGGLRGQSHL
jgi:hypothetical protein